MKRPRFIIQEYHYLYFAIYDVGKKDFIRTKEGEVITRDSIKSAQNLLSSIESRVASIP